MSEEVNKVSKDIALDLQHNLSELSKQVEELKSGKEAQAEEIVELKNSNEELKKDMEIKNEQITELQQAGTDAVNTEVVVENALGAAVMEVINSAPPEREMKYKKDADLNIINSAIVISNDSDGTVGQFTDVPGKGGLFIRPEIIPGLIDNVPLNSSNRSAAIVTSDVNTVVSRSGTQRGFKKLNTLAVQREGECEEAKFSDMSFSEYEISLSRLTGGVKFSHQMLYRQGVVTPALVQAELLNTVRSKTALEIMTNGTEAKGCEGIFSNDEVLANKVDSQGGNLTTLDLQNLVNQMVRTGGTDGAKFYMSRSAYTDLFAAVDADGNAKRFNGLNSEVTSYAGIPIVVLDPVIIPVDGADTKFDLLDDLGTGNKPILLANLDKGYRHIIESNDAYIQREIMESKHCEAIYLHWYNGGGVVDPNQFAYLEMTADPVVREFPAESKSTSKKSKGDK
jgi:HK97 family phage major capsid protein